MIDKCNKLHFRLLLLMTFLLNIKLSGILGCIKFVVFIICKQLNGACSDFFLAIQNARDGD